MSAERRQLVSVLLPLLLTDSKGAQKFSSQKAKNGDDLLGIVQGLRGETKWIDLCNTDEEFNSMTMKHLKEKIRHCFSYMSDISGKSSERQSESLL